MAQHKVAHIPNTEEASGRGEKLRCLESWRSANVLWISTHRMLVSRRNIRRAETSRQLRWVLREGKAIRRDSDGADRRYWQ